MYRIAVACICFIFIVGKAAFADAAGDLTEHYIRQGEILADNADKVLAQPGLTSEEKLYIAEMKFWGAVCRYGANDKNFDEKVKSVADSLKNITEAADVQQQIAEYLTQRKTAKPEADTVKPVLSLLDKMLAAYYLLLPEASRAEDVLAIADKILALSDLTKTEREKVTIQRIEALANAAFLRSAEKPDTNPAAFYIQSDKAVEKVGSEYPQLLNDKKIVQIQIGILYQMLDYLKHTSGKETAFREIQNRYVKLLPQRKTEPVSLDAVTSAALAQFATDFARTIPELRWDGAMMAGIGFLEAVIPLFEKSGEPVLQAAAEKLVKTQRRFILSGKPFELECVLLDGTKLNAADLKGKVVLVDFWATWCPSCRGSFPNKVVQYEKYKDKGLEMLAYSVDKDVEALRKYQEQHKFPWKNGSLTLSKAAGLKDYEKFYGIWGIPTTYILDRSGKAVFMQVESNNEKLNEALQKILGE
jgi:thiol-disulfide isomerase/thioredoxin